MNLQTVTRKLIGSIEPYGDTNINAERLCNLDQHISVTYALLKDLIDTAKYIDRREHSIRVMAEKAHGTLEEFERMIENVIG